MGRLVSVAEQVVFSIRHFTVEPIIIFVYFGWVFGNMFQSPGLYRRVCQIYYSNDPAVNCYKIEDSGVEEDVQRHSAEWSLYNAIAYLTPAIFADTLLGAYGDRHGRKINILFGIMGVAVSEFGYLLTISKSFHTPYWTTVIFGLFTGATGYIALIPVSCNAYLADITTDSDLLTIRSGLFSVAQTLASVVGGIFAALLDDSLSIATAVDVELTCYVLAMAYVLWKIPQRPGIQELERRAQLAASPETTSKTSIKSFLYEIIVLLKEGLYTYRRRRLGHRRAFIFICVCVLMLTYTTSDAGSLLTSYVFRRTSNGTLDWNTKDLGYWNGSGFLILIIGTLGGLYVFKQLLRLRETSLILIGLVSSSMRTAIMGLASQDWHMYVANVVGGFSGLVQPAVVSFIFQLVPSEEVGRAFSLLGIAGDAAFIVTSLAYNVVYRSTEHWQPGFTFLMMAAIQTVATVAMLWVHIKAKSERVGRASTSSPSRRRTTGTTVLDPPDGGRQLSVLQMAAEQASRVRRWTDGTCAASPNAAASSSVAAHRQRSKATTGTSREPKEEEETT